MTDMTLKDDTDGALAGLLEEVADPLARRQFEMEDAAIADRLQEIQRYETHLAEGEQLSRSSSSRRLLREILEPAIEAVRAGIAEATGTGRPGRHNAACALLATVPPEAATMTTLSVLLDGMDRPRSFQGLAKTIGRRVFVEDRIVTWAGENPKLVAYLKKHFKTEDTRYQYRYLRAMASRMGVEFPDMDWGQEFACGAWLLGVFTQSSGLFERARTGIGKRDASESIVPTERLLSWVARSNKTLSEVQPIWPPMILPPKEWSADADGGYRFALAGSAQFVGGCSSKRSQEIRRTAGPIVLAAANHLQATRWRINRNVLKVFRGFLERDGISGGAETIAQSPFPAHPLGDQKPLELWTASDHAQVERWRRMVRDIHVANWHARTRALKAYKVLAAAEKYEEETGFYYAVHFDFRGRVYYRGTGLNPQGPDRQRALLEFAEGRILTDRGRKALALHGIGRLGKCPWTGTALDKQSIMDRLDWVMRMQPDIIMAADYPLRDDWWTKADDPWQFLAFCFAWRDQYIGKPVHLPVQIDGTCNGYQHLAAMSRDQALGNAVNLAGGLTSVPADLYLQVASDVSAALLSVPREELGGLADIPGILTRSVVKTPVMTAPYGATAFGMAESIEASLRASGKIPKDAENVRKGCVTIAREIQKAAAMRFSAADTAKQFIANLCGFAAANSMNLAWTSPSGFPVEQRYGKKRLHRMSITLPGRIRMEHRLSVHGGELDKRQSVQSASPNVIQSLDAAHMHRTAWKAAESGLEMGGIHDCILHHANDAPEMAMIVREAFVETHAMPFLQVLAEEFPECPLEVPKTGSLNLDEVLHNPFFFS